MKDCKCSCGCCSIECSCYGKQNEEGAVEDTLVSQPVSRSQHPHGVVCRRSGYFTTPSLFELAQVYPDENGCVYVNDFTVGLDGVGKATFKGKTNVVNLNIDRIVNFTTTSVEAYTNETKPPIGEGLNKETRVTLYNWWPVPSSANHLSDLHSMCARAGTTFIDWSPVSGQLVFDVPHFSKYEICAPASALCSNQPMVPNSEESVLNVEVHEIVPVIHPQPKELQERGGVFASRDEARPLSRAMT